MTTQYADLSTVSGQTLTANLFAVDGDTILYTADSVTERTNAKGVYRCTFGEASAISGTYRMILFSGATPFAEGIRVFSGTDTEVASARTENLSTRLPAALVSGRIDASVGAMAANTVTASALATDAVTEMQSGLATAANLATVDTVVDAIKLKTDNLPSDPADQSAVEAAITASLGTGTWATAIPWNAAWDAEVQSEVQDAIEVNHLDHLLAADYDPASKPGVATALLNELVGNDLGVSQFTAHALELAPSGGGGGDATLAKQEEILDALDTYITQALATVNGTADTIVGFPTSLNLGDSYTEDGGNAIHIFIRDENDIPITSVGDHEFTDPDFAPEIIITNSGNAGRVKATVTYVDPGAPESYLKVEIPLSESRRAAPGAATMQCILKWDGCQKTLATQTVTWVARI